ncbi:MAG: hypothetical protein Q8P24_09325 [Desulfobacterales bacterium]|nr:hypothetical protein [Desulfobacterales bacterium]
MDEVRFVDTTLRDGDQSLWGYRLTTGMILPVAAQMDQIGFEAIDVIGLSPFKLRVRQQKEEPWDRLRLLAKKITRTPLSVMGGVGIGGFGVAPRALIKLRTDVQAALGVNRVQLMDPTNDMSFMIPDTIRFSHAAGLEVLIALIFSESPKHTDEYYAQKTREAVKLKPDRIYLKDPSGLLTPERVQTLIPAIQANSKGMTLELHSHCTTGQAPLCYLEAIKLGIRILHTGIPPLANGPAQPSLFNVARNACLMGYSTQIDQAPARLVSRHFSTIAKREGLPPGIPLEYDYSQYLHQIPGGVISNLKRQLTEMKMQHRFEDILKESINVRKDLGYPIMVTPFSQHVVTQATLNVILGKQYKEVPDEIIQYATGYFGEEASRGVDPDVKNRILDRPRAEELARCERYEPSIEELRRQIGEEGIPDDELLLRYIMGGQEELKAMRPAAPIREYPVYRTPLILLTHELSKYANTRYISIKKGDFTLRLTSAADGTATAGAFPAAKHQEK